MTRKHFRAIAERLKAGNASIELCRSFANMCADENPRFDRAKFLEACGH